MNDFELNFLEKSKKYLSDKISKFWVENGARYWVDKNENFTHLVVVNKLYNGGEALNIIHLFGTFQFPNNSWTLYYDEVNLVEYELIKNYAADNHYLYSRNIKNIENDMRNNLIRENNLKERNNK